MTLFRVKKWAYIKPVITIDKMEITQMLLMSHEETVEFKFDVNTNEEWKGSDTWYLE